MNMRFLFFDIECANTFNNICKLCSFGYVIMDEHFNLIEQRDIIINPEDIFDPYFFKPDSNISLPYKKEEYVKQPNFISKYEEILSIFNNEVDFILGFDIDKDFKYLKDACLRYNLKLPAINGYDVKDILKHFGITGKLHQIAKRYLTSDSNAINHKSDDDALLTAKLLEFLCQHNQIEITCLLKTILDKFSLNLGDIDE